MPAFGNVSRTRLDTCHPLLIELFERVVAKRDCTILRYGGHRDEQTQNRLFDEGKSKTRYPEGKHCQDPSEAVDAAPYPIPDSWGDYRQDATRQEIDLAWKERVKFYELAALVKAEAAEMGIQIRWGGDWDSDGDYRDQRFEDLVHYEIIL